METRVSYTLVGLFVIVLTFAVIGAGLYLGGDIRTTPHRDFALYMDESVAGLNVSAPVRYHGVDVGRVQGISLNPEHPDEVRVVISVEEGVPVGRETVATIRSQGLTGISFIELSGSTTEPVTPDPRAGDTLPEITTTPSFGARVEQTVDEALGVMSVIADEVRDLLREENRERVSRLLHNAEILSGNLADSTGELDQTVARVNRLLEQGNQTAERLPDSMDRLDATLDRWAGLADDLGETGEALGTLATRGETTLIDLNQSVIPELGTLLYDIQRLSRDLDRTLEEFSDEPQMLIYGRQPIPPGPGEEAR
ncbi:phospholipid/cholesterol/gamma-HCH transport system substrate-binding protein [Alkalispirillum mobile]|uniref:Phospholipid/cholesterol/gamma-HCH transport system substrate-binding protein n=1 Tax=Alkalispirillum mobile TaxID=85925 RepID=A0A498CD66_9GAMM|nr:MlaD family protein [Alkalispirillum mobile]RLK50171.1 phospholipid/cholesterol/gamma-HCH transport system substrate-binding protein [Alkalispirillum mobile]